MLLGIGPVVAPPVASAAGRVALVMGNSDYAAIGALPNPGNDAADVSDALGRLGFDVTTVLDADRRWAMNEALRTFTRESAGADVALVFYAGHGLEMDGVNYLVPVDARLERDTDVRFEAVEMDDVLAATAGAELRVVILDACRNNPLAGAMQRSSTTRNVSRGSFGELDDSLLGEETLVAYAAAAGTTAADGTGRNSPYTAALLEYLEQPLEIGILFREVRARVLQATGGEQRPSRIRVATGRALPARSIRGARGGPGCGRRRRRMCWDSRRRCSGSRSRGARTLRTIRRIWSSFPTGSSRGWQGTGWKSSLCQRVIRRQWNPSPPGPQPDTAPERDPPPSAERDEPVALLPVNGSPSQLVPHRSATGTLDDASLRAGRWTLDGVAGQTITVSARSDDFDTTVRLMSPTGEQIGYDDDGGDGLNSRLAAWLPLSGRYEAIVESYRGDGDGTYEVTVYPGALISTTFVEGTLDQNGPPNRDSFFWIPGCGAESCRGGTFGRLRHDRAPHVADWGTDWL